ncbi:MAG: nucleoside monophosphate kinase [bacterium]|nr:nucleoside monophosphate kinase [bacterium]
MPSQREIFVFLGPPGSGKGSLANLCKSNVGCEHFSTGNLCRRHINEQTEIGKKIDLIIKSGKLIPDELVSQMVDGWLSEKIAIIQTVIFDGYPRTIEQAKIFDHLLKTKFPSVQLHIIRLAVSDETIITRLSARYICKKNDCQAVYSLINESSLSPKIERVCDYCQSALTRRKDDEPETIRKRLQGYYQYEKMLLDFYQKAGYQIVEVDVEKPINAVFDEFKQCVGI